MRDNVIDAASQILTEKGLGGLTLAETGARVGLKVTSITHYFKRKDDLAAACFDQALTRLTALADAADREPDPLGKVRRYIDGNIAILRAARLGEQRPIPVLSGIMTLGQAQQEPLMARYHALFRQVRGFFGDTSDPNRKTVLTARAHVLLETVFWLSNPLRDYALEDFDRFGDHLFRILRDGLAGTKLPWQPVIFDVAIPVESRGLRDLILAATTLINEQGYKGASVNKVVALLDLTKGSFYHHLKSRDALTLECFRASYGTIAAAQRTGQALQSDAWTRLTSVIASLLAYQFSTAGPLLRTTALQGLPLDQRQAVLAQARTTAEGFADLITDAFVEADARPCDARIAGQVVNAMILAAYVMVNWAGRQPIEDAVRIYASTVLNGLFADVPPQDD